jgi:hypothetical protein
MTINVGVILSCVDSDCLEARIELDAERLRVLDSSLTWHLFDSRRTRPVRRGTSSARAPLRTCRSSQRPGASACSSAQAPRAWALRQRHLYRWPAFHEEPHGGVSQRGRPRDRVVRHRGKGGSWQGPGITYSIAGANPDGRRGQSIVRMRKPVFADSSVRTECPERRSAPSM